MKTNQEEDGTVSYEGFCIDLFKELAKELNFTYEIYLSPDGQYGGKTENDTWNGIMGELVNRVSTLRDISLVRLVNVTQCVLSVPSSLVVVIIINVYTCREDQITTVKRLRRGRFGRCFFVKANRQSLLRSKHQINNFLPLVTSSLLARLVLELLPPQPMALIKKSIQ